jgi:hypothetical protein
MSRGIAKIPNRTPYEDDEEFGSRDHKINNISKLDSLWRCRENYLVKHLIGPRRGKFTTGEIGSRGRPIQKVTVE